MIIILLIKILQIFLLIIVVNLIVRALIVIIIQDMQKIQINIKVIMLVLKIVVFLSAKYMNVLTDIIKSTHIVIFTHQKIVVSQIALVSIALLIQDTSKMMLKHSVIKLLYRIVVLNNVLTLYVELDIIKLIKTVLIFLKKIAVNQIVNHLIAVISQDMFKMLIIFYLIQFHQIIVVYLNVLIMFAKLDIKLLMKNLQISQKVIVVQKLVNYMIALQDSSLIKTILHRLILNYVCVVSNHVKLKNVLVDIFIMLII